ELLELTVTEHASDLHISPGLPPMVRIDGDLLPKELPPFSADQTRQLVYSVLDEKQQQEFETTLEYDFAVTVPGVSIFRVNAFHQKNGIAAVFRVIAENPPTLDDLKLPEVFKQFLEVSNGLILVTGPTGSGKSTTLAAMINHINVNYPYHIITVEDPIEYVHQSKKSLISQRQVHRDTQDFAAALRAALREDPDVILVGEMRDLETIRLALTAAETGHLVLATLHTSSAPRSVNRIVDVFPAGEKNIIRNMLSESLTAVICQTLLKKISGGRAAALEIMVGTSAIRNLIREDKVAQMMTAIQTGREVGMCTLDQSLLDLVNQQAIAKTTAYEAAANKELFK
ncbi:MAG TPA: type IV pilus twitching motility protein PilT, partial [Gammaproteobacteria bacterium]|nr:type IV pilus twitching motility protein PilT [Gammaproteobacteria bacterium]